ncbi:MAG: hypothetical protein M3O82_02800 [Verrucomicrobiota bacterium]|nr:hypothetical protein [Verrucomicrobiota bacterium]
MKRERTSPLETRGTSGSVMAVALLTFAVLSMIMGTVALRTMTNYHTIIQVGGWQEAMLAAESGTDIGMCALRKTLTDPANAWNGWTTTAANGVTLPNNGKRYVAPTLVHNGEGNTDVNFTVTVDAPAAPGSLIDSTGKQWYRIRSTGTTYLPATLRPGNDKRDRLLRKIDFLVDHVTHANLTRPQAVRTVEMIARPVSFDNALISAGVITLNDHDIVIDSFDSRDPAKSTNGNYDEAKFQQNGNIATDGSLIEAGNAHVYGDVYTNAGTVANAANVTGEQRTDFYQDLFPIPTPTWTVIQPSASTISGNTTLPALTGSSASNPTRYKVNSVGENGNTTLTFSASSPNTPSYIELWVTGDFTSTGTSQIVIDPGVKVKVYVAGNVAVTGNGFVNGDPNPKASDLQVLGIQPPRVGTTDPSVYQSRTVSIDGSGAFVGVIYAPNADVSLSNSGSKALYWGSIVGKTITMNGDTSVHYDEALSQDALTTDYRLASWFEDNR